MYSIDSEMAMTSEKVCIVLRPGDESIYGYYIYMLDVSEREEAQWPEQASVYMLDVSEREEAQWPEQASVRISRDAPDGMAFTVRDSTLYMFGGVANNGGQTTTAFTYPLLPGSYTTIEPFKAGMQAISSMRYPKCEPCAVLLDNKICVFSSKFQCGATNFELYYPETNDWSTMPNPPLVSFDAIDVTYYYVVGSKLLIHCTDKNKMILSHTPNGKIGYNFKVWSYSFDTGSFQWRCLDFPLRLEESPYPCSCVEGDGLLLSPLLEIFDFEATKPEGRVAWEFFQLCGKGEIEFIGTHYAIAGLQNKKVNERLRVCMVRVGGPPIPICRDIIQPLLAIDLVSIDSQATLDVLKSHVFRLDPTIYTYESVIVGVFPV